MPTYSAIQKVVQRRHGFIPEPAWIDHVKFVWGLPTLRAANRAGKGRRVVPCPPDKREAIEEALRHFGLTPRATPPETAAKPRRRPPAKP